MGRQATRVFVNEKSREDEGAIRTRAEDYHQHNLHCPKHQSCINTRLPWRLTVVLISGTWGRRIRIMAVLQILCRRFMTP